MVKSAPYTAVVSSGREFALSPGDKPSCTADACLTDPAFRVPGWNVSFFTSIDSTNLEARRRLASGKTGKQVIIADSQTMGQCRHDRLWESMEGHGMWASFILPVAVSLSVLAQSTLVLAVAVREAVHDATGLALETKWPNDLLASGKKCCGLLVESGELSTDTGSHHLILGVGINMNHASNDFPEYLRGVATSLSIMANGKRFSREKLVNAVARSIETWFARWEKDGFSPVRHAWLDGNCTIGNGIILPDGYGYSHATAHDLDKSGALVALADDGTALLIDSGEIRFTL